MWTSTERRARPQTAVRVQEIDAISKRGTYRRGTSLIHVTAAVAKLGHCRRSDGHSNMGHAMKRVGFVLKVKQDKLEEYKRHHEQVSPEMLQALREAGWHNYSLFVRDDGLLFGYFETPESLQAAQARMAEKEVNTW